MRLGKQRREELAYDTLALWRHGIDTYQEAVVFMIRDWHGCRASNTSNFDYASE